MPTPSLPTSTSFGLLVLRLGIGGYMVTHGWPKLQMLLAGDADKFPDPLGMGYTLSLVSAVGAELVCALLLVAGLATRLAALPLAFTMVVAAFVVHAQDPWTMLEGARLFKAGEAQSSVSKEPALLYLVPFVALVFTGAGRFSADAWLWPRMRARKGGKAPAAPE